MLLFSSPELCLALALPSGHLVSRFLIPGLALFSLLAVVIFRVRQTLHSHFLKRCPQVTGTIDHIYPIPFRGRMLLKLHCTCLLPDGAPHEFAYDFFVERGQEEPALDRLYRARIPVYLTLNPLGRGTLRKQDIKRHLQTGRVPEAAVFAGASRTAVDLAAGAASH